MRIYNYFIFRLYFYYKDVVKEKDIPEFATSIGLSVINLFNFLTAYFILEINFNLEFDYVGYLIGISSIVFLLINYFFFVKPKHFLNMGFESSVLGSILVITYVLLSLVLFIYFINLARDARL